ncbi:hypothetical protein EMIT0373P_40469 [Pseudomonas chlororaphis]
MLNDKPHGFFHLKQENSRQLVIVMPGDLHPHEAPKLIKEPSMLLAPSSESIPGRGSWDCWVCSRLSIPAPDRREGSEPGGHRLSPRTAGYPQRRDVGCTWQRAFGMPLDKRPFQGEANLQTHLGEDPFPTSLLPSNPGANGGVRQRNKPHPHQPNSDQELGPRSR